MIIGLGLFFLSIVQTTFAESILLKPLSPDEVYKKLAESKSIQVTEQKWKESGEKTDIRSLAAFEASLNKDFKVLLQSIDENKFVLAQELLAKFPKPKEGYDFAQSNIVFYAAAKYSKENNLDESYALLKELKPTSVVDPSAYYFYKAVAEKGTRDKENALASIKMILTGCDPAKTPERYIEVAARMKEEIENWEEDLGDVARMMDEVKKRLDNAKGGKKTQGQQNEIVKKLDQAIKKLEDEMNKQNQQQQQASGNQRAQQPTPESKIMQGEGKGEVQNKKLIQTSEVWGKMPEKEKVKAMEALQRQLPPHIREAAEGFSKKLQNGGKK